MWFLVAALVVVGHIVQGQVYFYGLADVAERGIWDWVRFDTSDGTDLIPEVLATSNYTTQDYFPVASFLHYQPLRVSVAMWSPPGRRNAGATNVVATLDVEQGVVDEWRFSAVEGDAPSGVLWAAPEGACQQSVADRWWMLGLVELANGSFVTQLLTVRPDSRVVLIRKSLGVSALDKCGCSNTSLWAEGSLGDGTPRIFRGMQLPAADIFYSGRMDSSWSILSNIYSFSATLLSVARPSTLFSPLDSNDESVFYLGEIQSFANGTARFRPLVLLPFSCPCSNTSGIVLHHSTELADSIFITASNTYLTEVFQVSLKPESVKIIHGWILLAQLVSPLQASSFLK